MRKLAAGAYLQRIVAGLVCLMAIVVAILDAVGDVPHWISLPSLTTAVLGLLVILSAPGPRADCSTDRKD